MFDLSVCRYNPKIMYKNPHFITVYIIAHCMHMLIHSSDIPVLVMHVRYAQPSLSVNHVHLNVILYILLLNRWKQAHSLLCIPQVAPNILYI